MHSASSEIQARRRPTVPANSHISDRAHPATLADTVHYFWGQFLPCLLSSHIYLFFFLSFSLSLCSKAHIRLFLPIAKARSAPNSVVRSMDLCKPSTYKGICISDLNYENRKLKILPSIPLSSLLNKNPNCATGQGSSPCCPWLRSWGI